MDLPLLLAVEIPDAWVAGVATFIALTVAPSVIAAVSGILKYVRRRDEQHEEAIRSLHIAQTKAISELTAKHQEETSKRVTRYNEIIGQKDAQIEALSKALSAKSDEHSKKIEELLRLCVEKIENLNEKDTARADRNMQILSALAQDLRRVLTGESARGPSD